MESHDASPASQKQASQDRLNESLSIIAQSVEVLAAKANEPTTEKDWDKAERERKKAHDNRTFKRQGWTIGIASVALAFNFVALGIAIYQGSNSRHSAIASEKSAKIAEQALHLAQQGRITIEAVPSFSFSDSDVSFATIRNIGNTPITLTKGGIKFIPYSDYDKYDKNYIPDIMKDMNYDLNSGIAYIESKKSLGDISDNEKKLMSTIYIIQANEYQDVFGDKYLTEECTVYKLNSDGRFYATTLCRKWNKTFKK